MSDKHQILQEAEVQCQFTPDQNNPSEQTQYNEGVKQFQSVGLLKSSDLHVTSKQNSKTSSDTGIQVLKQQQLSNKYIKDAADSTKEMKKELKEYKIDEIIEKSVSSDGEMSQLRNAAGGNLESEKINTDLTVHIKSNSQLKNYRIGVSTQDPIAAYHLKHRKEVLPLRTVTISQDEQNNVGLLDIDLCYNESVFVGSNTPVMGGMPPQKIKPALVKVKQSFQNNESNFQPLGGSQNNQSNQTSLNNFQTNSDGNIFDPTGLQPFKLFHIAQNTNEQNEALSQLPIVSNAHLIHPAEDTRLPPMKVIGQNKINLEQAASAQQNNITQSKMRDLLAMTYVNDMSQDQRLTVSRPSEVIDAARSTKKHHRAREKHIAIIDSKNKRHGHHGEEEDTFDVIFRETGMQLDEIQSPETQLRLPNHPLNSTLLIQQQETLTVGLKQINEVELETSLTVYNDEKTRQVKNESENQNSIQPNELVAITPQSVIKDIKQINSNQNSRLKDINENDQESNIQERMKEYGLMRGNVTPNMDKLQSVSPESALPTPKRSILKVNTQSLRNDPYDVLITPSPEKLVGSRNLHAFNMNQDIPIHQDFQKEVLLNNQKFERQLNQFEQNKGEILSPSNHHGSLTSFGNTQSPDRTDRGQESHILSKNKFEPLTENRTGLSKTTMVFVVNKKNSTVNNRGINPIQLQIPNKPKNGTQKSNETIDFSPGKTRGVNNSTMKALQDPVKSKLLEEIFNDTKNQQENKKQLLQVVSNKYDFGVSMSPTVNSSNNQHLYKLDQHSSTPQSIQRGAFKPNRSQKYRKQSKMSDKFTTKVQQSNLGKIHQEEIEGKCSQNGRYSRSVVRNKVNAYNFNEVKTTPNQGPPSKNIQRIFNNEGIATLNQKNDKLKLVAQTPQSPSMSEIKNVLIDKKPPEQYHLQLQTVQNKKEMFESQQTLDKPVDTFGHSTPHGGQNTKNQAMRFQNNIDSLSQIDNQSSIKFMDKFKGFNNSTTQEIKNYGQDVEALKKNVQNQINQMEKPSTSVQGQDRENLIKQFSHTPDSTTMDFKQTFGVINLQGVEVDEKQGNERLGMIKKKPEPGVLHSQIQNVSKMFKPKRLSVDDSLKDTNKSRLKKPKVQTIFKNDLNLDIKLSLKDNQIVNQNHKQMRYNARHGSMMQDKDSVMTDLLSPMVGARMSKEGFNGNRAADQIKIDMQSNETPNTFNNGVPNLQSLEVTEQKTLSLFPPLKQRNISPRYRHVNDSNRFQILKKHNNIKKPSPIDTGLKFQRSYLQPLSPTSLNTSIFNSSAQNNLDKKPENKFIQSLKDQSPFKCIKLMNQTVSDNKEASKNRPSVITKIQDKNEFNLQSADNGNIAFNTIKIDNTNQEKPVVKPEFVSKALGTDFVDSPGFSKQDSLQEYVNAQEAMSPSNSSSNEKKKNSIIKIRTPIPELQKQGKSEYQQHDCQSDKSEDLQQNSIVIHNRVNLDSIQLQQKLTSTPNPTQFLDIKDKSNDINLNKATGMTPVEVVGPPKKLFKPKKKKQTKNDKIKQQVREYVQENLNKPATNSKEAADLQQIANILNHPRTQKATPVQFSAHTPLTETPASIKYVRRIKNSDFWSNKNSERQNANIISQYSQEYEKLCIMNLGLKDAKGEEDDHNDEHLQSFKQNILIQDPKKIAEILTKDQIENLTTLLKNKIQDFNTLQEIQAKFYENFSPPLTESRPPSTPSLSSKRRADEVNSLIKRLNIDSGSNGEQTMSNQFIMSQLRNQASERVEMKHLTHQQSGDSDIQNSQNLFKGDKRSQNQSKGSIKNQLSHNLSEENSREYSILQREQISNNNSINPFISKIHKFKVLQESERQFQQFDRGHAVTMQGQIGSRNHSLQPLQKSIESKDEQIHPDPKALIPNLQTIKNQMSKSRCMSQIRSKTQTQKQIHEELNNTDLGWKKQIKDQSNLQNSHDSSNEKSQEYHPLEYVTGRKIQVKEGNQIQNMARYNMINNIANTILKFGEINGN